LAIIVVGLWVFSSKRKHLLITLLSLEFIVLGVFLLFYTPASYCLVYFSLIYVTVTACEGALGLTVLVSIRRTHGGDYFKSFHLDY